jgi:Uri superfamily endonuclease
MRGVYVLIIQVPHNLPLRIKSLGEFVLKRGTWVYIGSAMGSGSTNLENRISRHFRKEKTIHWHIDALLQHSVNLQTSIWAESYQPMECKVVHSIENKKEFISGPAGFGASDCKNNCTSHLFQCLIDQKVKYLIKRIFVKLGLEPRITHDGLVS